MRAIGHRLALLLAAALLASVAAAVDAHPPPAAGHCNDEAVLRAIEAGGVDSLRADSHLHCHHGGWGEIGAASSPPRIDPLSRPQTARSPVPTETVARKLPAGYALRAVHTRLYILFESLLI